MFDLSPGHLQEFPQQFLAGYRGCIHADGCAAYNALYAAGANHIGCWMHVRLSIGPTAVTTRRRDVGRCCEQCRIDYIP